MCGKKITTDDVIQKKKKNMAHAATLFKQQHK